MNHTPKISVIIPSYCHEQFIKNAIMSVVNQTFEDFELIIIDDQSTDNSVKIIKEIEDPRIILEINENNLGSAHTINKGIRQAKGKYIAILNSDDLFHPERLARCINECEEKNLFLTGTDISLIDDQANVIENKLHWWIEWYDYLKSNYYDSNDLVQALLSGNLFISTSNFFFKKSFIDDIGGFQNLKFVQDYEFVLRALSKHENHISWIPEKLLFYRLHQKNTISSDSLKSNKQTLNILLAWLPDFFTDTPESNARVKTITNHLKTISRHLENVANDNVIKEIELTHHNWAMDSKRLKDEIEQIHRNWAMDSKRLQDEIEQIHRNWAMDSKRLQDELKTAYQNWSIDTNRLRNELETLRNTQKKNLFQIPKPKTKTLSETGKTILAKFLRKE